MLILLPLFLLLSCSQGNYKNEIDITQDFMQLVKEEKFSDAKNMMEANFIKLPGVDASLSFASQRLERFGIPSSDKAHVKNDTFLGVGIIVISYEMPFDNTGMKSIFTISIGKSKFKGKIVMFGDEFKAGSSPFEPIHK